jgi:acyl-CoA synthetase (NDP forming)
MTFEDIIGEALRAGRKTLSEYEAKRLLEGSGIPVVREELAADETTVLKAAQTIGYPVVLKFCSAQVMHKTEKGLIEVNLRDERDLRDAFQRMERRAKGSEGAFLVQAMVRGSREFVMGVVRDPQFGPCVMFGLGGIFAEILQDVTFRVAPVRMQDALEMMGEIKGSKILDAVRGLERVDREALGWSLIALGKLGLENPSIQEIDVNPLLVCGSQPVAVDALVVLRDG